MKNIDFVPFFISIKLALISTLILLIIAIPITFWLSKTKVKSKPIIEAIISLPLVLPPSVLGFYLLIFLSPYNFFGKFLDENFDIRLVFNFTGLIIASCIYSLPFMFQPLISGFSSLPKSLFEASASLGKSQITTLFKVALPNIKPSLLTAIIVSFAHTLGEFGVVLMIGGSTETTKVASIAIYEAVELMDYQKAHIYSVIMLAFSFIVLFVVYFLNQKSKKN
jgi:molybdate ABC transporter, permease protein